MYRLSKNLPIGVYDSGVGGLCVMKELLKSFPYESFVYFGDNGNAPYGDKTIDELKSLCNIAIKKLKRKKVKAIVIACNTLSTNLYNYIRDTSALETIKTIPEKCLCKTALLFCTPLTAKSYQVKENFKGKVVPCENLALQIETHVFNLNKVSLDNVINDIPKNTSEIMLGCTHYYYLKSQIEGLTGLKVGSGFEKVKKELYFKLKSNSLLKNKGKQKVTFIGKFRKKNKKVFKKVL